MPDTTKPIEVSANAPLIDLLTALGRYLVVLATSVPILLQLFGTRDVVSIIAYFQGEDGKTLLAAVVGASTLLYGLWKTRGRAAQVTSMASDQRVPASVATIKQSSAS